MAGASGFLGTRLADRLTAAGHEITRLVRRQPRGSGEAAWKPSQGDLDPALVAAADAVINLAGAGVGDKRWTAGYKRLLRSSRVDTTGTSPARSPAAAGRRPAAGAAAGLRGRLVRRHRRPRGHRRRTGRHGFLADLCRVWEAAARPAEDAGTRVVLLRTGLPLDAGGGLLKPLLLPFRLGAGAKLGSGRQWMPWIALADWLAAAEFLLDRDDLAGPVNVVGPAPGHQRRVHQGVRPRGAPAGAFPMPGAGPRRRARRVRRRIPAQPAGPAGRAGSGPVSTSLSGAATRRCGPR